MLKQSRAMTRAMADEGRYELFPYSATHAPRSALEGRPGSGDSYLRADRTPSTPEGAAWVRLLWRHSLSVPNPKTQ